MTRHVNQLEAVHLGEDIQWIRVVAARVGAPLLLLIGQGPGLPMINEAQTFERALALEADFTVVYWDQRGCGRSLRPPRPAVAPSLELMVNDTEQLLQSLCDRFGGPATVCGFSLGASIAIRAAARRPDLVSTVITVGMDVDGPAAERSAYEFALAQAGARHPRRALRQLRAMSAAPHTAQGVRHARALGGQLRGRARGERYATLVRSLVGSLLRSPDYAPADVLRNRGINAAQSALLPELGALDLMRTVPRLDTAVVMVQGRTRSRRAGGCRGALRRGARCPEQAARVVRALGAHAPPRGTGSLPDLLAHVRR